MGALALSLPPSLGKATTLRHGAVITLATDTLDSAMFALRFLKPLTPLTTGKIDLLHSMGMGLPEQQPSPGTGVVRKSPPRSPGKQMLQVRYGIDKSRSLGELPPGMPPTQYGN